MIWWKRLRIWLGRNELHRWLVYLERECPEAGLHPCQFGYTSFCCCHLIAEPDPKKRARFPIMAPRRDEMTP